MLRISLLGGFLVPAVILLLAGCGESTRVERRELSQPRKAGSDQEAHPSPMENPHGMTENPHGTTENPHGTTMSPHGEGALPPEDWKNPAQVDLDHVHLTAPKDWVRKPRKSAFVMAEFALPRAKGDPADGRLTITTAGGTVEENVARWRTQFVGKPEKASQESFEAAGNKVTLVDFSGTYLVTNMPLGSEATEARDYRMLGAIADVGGQLYFVKAYGPAKTMAAEADEFRAFVKSLKVGKE